MAMSGKLMSLALAAAMLLELTMATNYTVGGLTGSWDSTGNLQSWAAAQSFLVGDNLIFQYTPTHDVLEVSKADHDSCQGSSPLQAYTGGTTVIPLSSPGKRYFICGTPGHCSAGMKLEINTLVSSITPPPVSSVTPAPVLSPMNPPPTESPLNPAPLSPVVPSAASSPLPENSIPSLAESPELTPTSSPSPFNLPLPAPSSAAATKYSLPVSLTAGLGLIIMVLLVF